MNFEKVEIFGFKSFADKVEIKFNDGITGIVGPNGCGKSNVADAIRWVLGEQSAKNLRGSSMQDVIFSGTQGRRSLSYCEVSLYFDNSTKIFDIDYNEVIITRKLYRSGESEYFINKQQARLRDIIELLHQCGIGKEGYTIIGQGKVEEIISAKPEDRRAIFEEATGIASFKSRKLESERKLDRTHENIIRYSDILSEIEKQLAPLEKQAEKAKEFNELSEELKYHELNTYVSKVDGVEENKNKIYVKIKGIEDENGLRQTEYDNTVKEYDRIFEEINESDEKLKNYNDELLEKRVTMEKSSGAKKLFDEKIGYMESQIKRAENEIQEDLKIIEESKVSKLKNEEVLSESEKTLKEYETKFTETSKKLATLLEKISLLEELQTVNTKKVIESIESLTESKVSKGTISIEKNNLIEKKKELSDKIDELCVKRDGLFNEKEKTDSKINDVDRAVFDLKNQISEKEESVRNGNEEVAKIDNKMYSLNSLITSLTTKQEFLKGLKDNYEGYIQSVKVLMTDSKSNPELKRRIKGVVAELIKCDKKFDVALETSLMAAAQNVVTATTDDAQYLIEYLKKNGIGRVTFLPITSVKSRDIHPLIESAEKETGALGQAEKIVSFDKQYQNIVSSLLGNTLFVDTLNNARLIAEKYRFAFKIVTLDGEVLSTQGAMTGGSKKETVGVISSERKIEEITEILNTRRAEMDELKKQKAILEEKRDKALDELSLTNEMYNGKRQEIVLEREKQANVENALSEVGREIESMQDLLSSVEKRIDDIDERYRVVSSGSEKLEETKRSASKSAEDGQAEYENLKKERDALSETNIELQVKITELKGQISSIREDNERLTKTVVELEENIKSLNKSNEGARGIIEEYKIEQEKIALSKEEQDEINRIREKISAILDLKTDLKERLNKNEQKKESLLERLNVLSEKKHNEEIALAKIDSDLEYMQQNILEQYQETYESAVKNRAENYDAVFGEQEIVRLRKKRNALGVINATAIDSCKELKERYDEMTTQKEDLIKAEDDLKKAIEEIKTEMLSQFNEGFVKINDNFQKIFKELFGGGRAMLQLDYTEVDDKLEAGIEIIAEPPGKKLQKLSLLSGGEKALTTIAILFAILKLRPMPFCVLDEIEAALDEANVDRFARYLRKFSQDTQFIVITHKKPTMEQADSLFGVTMQEKGVSKIVSVKLSDIADIEDLKKDVL